MSGLFVSGSGSLAGDAIGPSNANTVVQLTGSAGVVAMLAASLLFGAAVAAPNIKQTAAASDVAPQNLSLVAQGPNAGAAVNKDAGDVIVNTPASVGGSTSKIGGLQIQYGGSAVAQLGTWRSTTTQGALWLGGGPYTSNTFNLFGDGSNTYVNAGGEIFFFLGNATQLGAWTASVLSTTTPIAFTARTSAAATGDVRGPKDFAIKVRNSANSADFGLIGSDTSNNVTVGDTGGGITQINAGGAAVVFSASGSVIIDGATQTLRDTGHVAAFVFSLNGAGASSAQWAAAVTPTISHAQSTIATTVSFTISAQAAKAASGAAGGNLVLAGGTPDGAGNNGRVILQSNSINYLALGVSGLECASTSVAVAAGNNTLTAAQFANAIIRLTGAIVGAPAVVILPNQAGYWIFDLSALTNTGGVQFKSGTTTSATIATPVGTTAQLIHVTCYGGNTVSVSV